jgi:D-glycero-D-manno-heptose 1,7-bisphosphate phosphatase
MSFVDPGAWCEIGSAVGSGVAALFLDRDGVIVTDTHYLCRTEDVRMVAGAAAAIARCNDLQIPVVVVTNQAGIGRGYYEWDAFHAVQGAISSELAAAGAHLDAVLACAYHGDGRDPFRIVDHSWRKPKPGMILEATSRMKIDLSRSWIIGDRAHDLAAGKAAYLAGGTLVGSDNQERETALRLVSSRFLVETEANLADAVAQLIDRGQLVDHVKP